MSWRANIRLLKRFTQESPRNQMRPSMFACCDHNPTNVRLQKLRIRFGHSKLLDQQRGGWKRDCALPSSVRRATAAPCRGKTMYQKRVCFAKAIGVGLQG